MRLIVVHGCFKLLCHIIVMFFIWIKKLYRKESCIHFVVFPDIDGSCKLQIFPDYANLNLHVGNRQRGNKTSSNNETHKVEINSSESLRKNNNSINKSCDHLADHSGSPKRRPRRRMYSNSNNCYVCFFILIFIFSFIIIKFKISFSFITCFLLNFYGWSQV